MYEDTESVHLVFEKVIGCTLQELVCREDEDDDDSVDLNNSDSDCLNQSGITFDSERKIKKLVRKLLFSVDRLHELGITHRDLKLENIMVLEDN